MQEVYINAYKKTTIIKKRVVALKDIAEVSAPSSLKADIEALYIFKIPDETKNDYLISIIDIINVITKEYPSVTINNVGEKDILVAYLPTAPKQNKIMEWLKIIGICFIIFAGATMAIMAYQADTSLAKAFTTLNKVFTGQEVDNPLFITIPYAIGIFVGVSGFYNHLGSKKLTDDPTPIQVEVTKYEKDVEDAIIDVLSYKERGQ